MSTYDISLLIWDKADSHTCNKYSFVSVIKEFNNDSALVTLDFKMENKMAIRLIVIMGLTNKKFILINNS